MALMCQTSLFFSHHTAFPSLLGLFFTCQLTAFLSLMTSSLTTESARERSIHPFETFWPLMDDLYCKIMLFLVIACKIWLILPCFTMKHFYGMTLTTNLTYQFLDEFAVIVAKFSCRTLEIGRAS